MFSQQLAVKVGALATAGMITVLPLYSLEAKPLPGELAEKDRAVRLEPSSPWQLELADDRCRLARRFDSANGPGV